MYKIVFIILLLRSVPYIHKITRYYQCRFSHKELPTGWIFHRCQEYDGKVNLLFIDRLYGGLVDLNSVKLVMLIK